MGMTNDEFPDNPLLAYEAETGDTRAAILCALEFLESRREEVIRMGKAHLKHPMKTTLGADQIGQLYMKVQPFLCPGETFLVEDVNKGQEDELILHVHGSRGTCLVAEMTDKGWTITEHDGQFEEEG